MRSQDRTKRDADAVRCGCKSAVQDAKKEVGCDMMC